MKKIDGIRVGNVEYIPGEKHEEIVLWKKNPYYNSRKRLLSEGFVEHSDSFSKDILHICKNMFENEFTCYTIAFVEWNPKRDEFDIRSVGTRAFNLEGSDKYNLKTVLDYIEKNTYGD